MSLLPVLLILLAITLPRLTFQPIWDSSAYLSRLNFILHTDTFNLLDYRVAHHASIAYYLFLRGSYFFRENIISCYLANTILLMASMTAFYGIAKMLMEEVSETEAALMAAIFGLAPLYVAHAFHVNLDFPLVSFLTIYLYFLIRERYGYASIFAVAICFTKEPGIPIYLGTLALKVGIDYYRTRGTWQKKTRRALRGKLILILLPALLLASYFAFLFAAGERMLWSAGRYSLFQAIDFNIFDASMRAYLANIFILNFNWIPMIFVFSLMIAVLRKGKRIFTRVRWDLVLFFFVLLCLTAYIVTRVRPFNHARYILPTYPALFGLAFIALMVFIQQRIVRIVILSIMAALSLASNFRTIDPLSRWVFGTFDFGNHKMLDVASIFGDSRRDELVYNLEYMNLQYLTNIVAEHLPIDRNSIIFIGGVDDSMWPFAVQMRNPRTGDLFTSTFAVRLLADQRLMTPDKMREPGSPSVFYFFAFPNNENGPNLNYLKDHYPLIGGQEFDYKGYRMKVYAFRNAPV